ncbi:unnamed protein product [Anisakis simplex]|uniref:FYVE-type domain-containing protein n=1 Tax=Anisakis simplex TaxID=6269 RepID=A0A0M3K772_ANISI|nr:unnamed protein product [Anisakis simplex]
MDSVPDMDELLDQLEASEDALVRPSIATVFAHHSSHSDRRDVAAKKIDDHETLSSNDDSRGSLLTKTSVIKQSVSSKFNSDIDQFPSLPSSAQPLLNLRDITVTPASREIESSSSSLKNLSEVSEAKISTTSIPNRAKLQNGTVENVMDGSGNLHDPFVDSIDNTAEINRTAGDKIDGNSNRPNEMTEEVEKYCGENEHHLDVSVADRSECDESLELNETNKQSETGHHKGSELTSKSIANENQKKRIGLSEESNISDGQKPSMPDVKEIGCNNGLSVATGRLRDKFKRSSLESSTKSTTNFGQTRGKTANEQKRMTQEYQEMDQYLTRFAQESSGQQERNAKESDIEEKGKEVESEKLVEPAELVVDKPDDAFAGDSDKNQESDDGAVTESVVKEAPEAIDSNEISSGTEEEERNAVEIDSSNEVSQNIIVTTDVTDVTEHVTDTSIQKDNSFDTKLAESKAVTHDKALSPSEYVESAEVRKGNREREIEAVDEIKREETQEDDSVEDAESEDVAKDKDEVKGYADEAIRNSELEAPIERLLNPAREMETIAVREKVSGAEEMRDREEEEGSDEQNQQDADNEAGTKPTDGDGGQEDGNEEEQGEEQQQEEGEEASEEVVMDEGSDDMAVCTEANIRRLAEGVQEISVVASTHDISNEMLLDMSRLTESELQLGKVKPVWIADSEAASCMLCCAKFTLILRRHHCRSCGRVLCAQCSAHKAVLPYMNDASKKFKVCEPCLQTLQRIAEYEKAIADRERSAVIVMVMIFWERIFSGAESTNSTDQPGTSTSSSLTPADIRRVTKSVLKVKTTMPCADSNEENPEAEGSGERTGASSELEGEVASHPKRSVKFLDGVNPGEGSLSDSGGGATPSIANAPEPSSLIPKPKKKRASVVRRVKELRMEEENVCLLPKEPNDPLYTRKSDGSIGKVDDINELRQKLNDNKSIVITISRNLWCNVKICNLTCCGLGRVMCISSCGMSLVGFDEILIVYDLADEDDDSSESNNRPIELPIDAIRRIREIYECSLKAQNESFEERMGIRAAHIRVPSFHSTNLIKQQSNDFITRDILLFRPTLQCFDNLIIPSSPFLVACFIHPSEAVWALAIPNRLLYRIGLQASYYPTPIVNRRQRKPVYRAESDTSVLKVFTDFRNWSYRMLMVHGSRLDLQDNESKLIVPKWARKELKELVESNRNMIAFALDFNASADSHLVCEQDEETGNYRTQVFTTGVETRKLTGASFIVIDGALKSGDSDLSISVVEDGIAVRLRPDAMTQLSEALCDGENYRLETNQMKFSLEWRSNVTTSTPLTDRNKCKPIPQLVSPIDQCSLMVRWIIYC